jgi:EpsD family peptidyl-prolyl cis-trans isomerase
MKRFFTFLILGSALAGCHPSPEGEVVAVVNGDEITRPELNAALSQVPAGTDAKLARNTILDRLINERLMVQAAKASGLDKSQDYVLKQHAAENLILASMFVKQTTDSINQSHVDNIDDYIAANPSRFAQRVLMNVDQLKVARQAVTDAWLKDAASLDQIGQVLAAHNVPFERGRSRLDSFTLEPADYRQIAAIPDGKPFAVVQNGILVFTAKISEQSAPMSHDDAQKGARALLQRKTGSEGLASRLKLLRSAAKIEYQPGFAAPGTPAAAAPNK